jgi:hypothetical protein
VDDFVPAKDRRALEEMPSSVMLGGERCPLDYEVDVGVGVVRVRLRERVARALREEDLPLLDRPLRFTVVRGKSASVRAATLQELRALVSGRERSDRGRRGRGRKHRRKL